MRKKLYLLLIILVLGITVTTYAATTSKEPTSEETNIAPEKSPVEEQLEMLEKGIVPTKPEETALLWAKAVKMRNGALQYALFTPKLKQKHKQALEQSHWVTGISSPWVESYKIISQKENKDKTIEVTVELALATSTGSAGKEVAKLTLVQEGEQWFIKELKSKDGQETGIWSAP